MRRFRLTLGVLALAAALPAIPAAVATTTAAPSGSPVVTIGADGGFVAPGVIKSRMPSLVAYPNGAVLVELAERRRPDLMSAALHVVDSTRLRALAAAIAKAAVQPDGGWGSPGVADVPSTYIRIGYAGMKRNISVYALGFTDGGDVTPAQASARKALQKAIDALTKAVNATKARAWTPQAYEAWTMAKLVKVSGVGMPNPASVFCESLGGTLGIVDTSNGQMGNCTLTDGTKVEEWAYFRATAKLFSAWPDGVAAPTTACTVVKAAKFAKALRGTNDTARWLLPTGQAPNFVFRPVLAGEKACKRS